MADKIEIEVIAKGLDAAKKDIDDLQKSMKKTGTEGKKSASLLESAWVKAAAKMTVAIAGVKKALDFSKEGAKIQQSMEATAQQFGVNVDKMVKKLREASGETVSNADLIESANRAMALNVTKDMDQMAELLEVARARAKAMGIDTTQAFSDIVTGIGRQSPLILDNLGIITKGWADEAKAAGQAFDAQFILNKVLSDGADIVKRSNPGILTMAERLAKMEAKAKNAGDALKRAFSAELVRIIEQVGTKGEDLFDIISNNITNLRRGFRLLLTAVHVVKAAFVTVSEVISASLNIPITLVQGLVNEIRIVGQAIIDTGEAFKLVAKGKFAEAAKSMKTNLTLAMQEISLNSKTTAAIIGEEMTRVSKNISMSYKDVANNASSAFKEIGDLSVKSNNQRLENATTTNEAIVENEKFTQEQLKAIREKALQQSKEVINDLFAFGKQKRATELNDFIAQQNEELEINMNKVNRRKNMLLEGLRLEKKAKIQQARESGADEVAIEKSYSARRNKVIEEAEEAQVATKKEAEERIRKEKQKTAKTDKAMAITMSIINTALAVSKALSSVSPPASYVLAAISAAAGSVQTGLIAAQPIPQYAQGTDFSAGGTALVGERGPELVDLPQGTTVTPNDRLGDEITNNNNVSITVQSNDPIQFVNELRQTYGLNIFSEAS